MASFTPGPWRLGEFEGVVRAGDRLIVSTMGYHDHHPGTRDQNLANARLIAAAPDLYEALKCLVEQTGVMPDYVSEVLHRVEG